MAWSSLQPMPLLRSLAGAGAFRHFLRPLMEHADLPVMRVTDQWLGWQVTQKPYGDAEMG